MKHSFWFLLTFLFVEILHDDIGVMMCFFFLPHKLISNVLESSSSLDVLAHVLLRPRLQLMSAPMETLTRAITAGLCRASLFDGANQDHDYYLAHAAGLRCLETCFPKETTEGQLLSAELFSLLSMCVLAPCL